MQLVKRIKGVGGKIEGSHQAGGEGCLKNMKIKRHCTKADLPTMKSVKAMPYVTISSTMDFNVAKIASARASSAKSLRVAGP